MASMWQEQLLCCMSAVNHAVGHDFDNQFLTREQYYSPVETLKLFAIYLACL